MATDIAELTWGSPDEVLPQGTMPSIPLHGQSLGALDPDRPLALDVHNGFADLTQQASQSKVTEQQPVCIFCLERWIYDPWLPLHIDVGVNAYGSLSPL